MGAGSGRIMPKKEATFGKKPFKGSGKNRKGSLKKVVTGARIKPKVSSKNSRCITRDDKDYLDYLHALDAVCFVCGMQKGIEWHHVKLHSCDKKDHRRLIPLCGVEHHRLGTVLSPHGTPRRWRDTYSIEFQNDFADEIYERFLADKDPV